MTTTITATSGADYVWSSASFTWDSAESGKGWADASATSFVATESDTLALSALEARQTYTDIIGFILQIAEAFTLLDRTSRAHTNLSKEQLAFLDRIPRASNAVIADLAFRTTPLDDEGFATLVAQSRPLGFSAFRDLTPGDYEYAKALVRLILEAPITTANRVALSEARLNIDVPDVRDRGTVAVAATGTVVAFNRVFNAPPEIQATFKSGTILAIPQIGAITTTGFEISLINPDTRTPVVGNASWSAEGY